jgi:hypothetical protein
MKQVPSNIQKAFQSTGIPPAGHDVKVPEPPKSKGRANDGP